MSEICPKWEAEFGGHFDEYIDITDVKKGKNVDLYSAYRVLHTSNALSSLN